MRFLFVLCLGLFCTSMFGQGQSSNQSTPQGRRAFGVSRSSVHDRDRPAGFQDDQPVPVSWAGDIRNVPLLQGGGEVTKESSIFFVTCRCLHIIRWARSLPLHGRLGWRCFRPRRRQAESEAFQRRLSLKLGPQPGCTIQ